MTAPALRPLTIGEILDFSFGLYRRHFVPLLSVQLICTALPFLINVYASAMGDTRGSVALSLVAFLISFVLSALATAATAYIVSESYFGRALGATDSLKRAWPKVGALLVLSLLVGLVLFAALLPFGLVFGIGMAGLAAALGTADSSIGAVAGLIAVFLSLGLLALPVLFFAGLSVATQSVVLENLGAGRAMSRSWGLTKGYRMRIALLLFVMLLLIMVPVIAVASLTGVFTSLAGGTSTAQTVLGTVVMAAVGLLITPLLYCVLTLLYYDLRVRKEGFDLELLAAALQTA